MDIDTKNSSGMMNGLPPTNKEAKRVGPIVGALVVVLLIIIIVLYFFGKKLNTQSVINDTQPATTQSSSQTAAVSSSSDIESIQNDLDNQLKDIDYSF